MMRCPYGFRILGGTTEERRLVDADAAFRGYAACDKRAQVEREAYLSAFHFGDDFKDLLKSTRSCRGFDGECSSPWLWFDIDRADDLDAALDDARKLVVGIWERFEVADEELLVLYSGAKGFHVGLTTTLWDPVPSAEYHRVARYFAENVAGGVGITIDGAIYDRVRAFRAPNSRHPKTGLHKRRLSLEELMGLSIADIQHLAQQPLPFQVPMPNSTSARAIEDWAAAEKLVKVQATASLQRRAEADGSPALNRMTLDFIRSGAEVGDRHRILFSAAANLAEYACPEPLAHVLLTEAGLDSGLSPAEVKRQIDCGLAHVGPIPSALISPKAKSSTNTPEESTPTVADQQALRYKLAALWGSSESGTPNVTNPEDPDKGTIITKKVD